MKLDFLKVSEKGFSGFPFRKVVDEAVPEW
jgi:hypothetical protein